MKIAAQQHTSATIGIEPKTPMPPTPTAADVRHAAKHGGIAIGAIPLRVRLGNIYTAVLAARAAAQSAARMTADIQEQETE